MTKQPKISRKNQTGQSLVEVALFLPIFVILIAGIVELSQLVITQNRVSNAARVSARFASNGGEDDGMVIVALNSVTQTLEMDTNRWDMWAVRGTVNQNGDGFSEWSFDHIYGISQTVLFSDVNEATIQQDVLDKLRTNEQGAGNLGVIAADLRIVGAYILHDTESILGLDAFPALAEFSSVRALNVMRITGLNQEQTKGCDAFPIAVRDDARSVTKPISELLAGEQSNHPFPEAAEFSCPSSSPQCTESVPPTYGQFTNHISNKPLNEAKEGYVYKIKEGTGSGNFGWLKWNVSLPPSSPVLAAALHWPGNSSDYSGNPEKGFKDAVNNNDESMNIGNWVSASTGNINSNDVRAELNEHMSRERTLRLIVWNETNGLSGQNLWYHISGFAIFRLHGYNSTSSNGGPWILAEFIRWDDSCGQEIPDSP